MSRIDQFESVFRAAAKPVYRHAPMALQSALLVTDLPAEAAAAFAARVARFVEGMAGAPEISWEVLDREAAPTVGALLERVADAAPDLVCAYRNLHSSGWRWPYTLGDHVVVLTQQTDVPVLLLPRPEVEAPFEARGPQRVMAVTDHLAGAQRLVQWAVAATRPSGTLYLGHVEDDQVFDRYMDLIGKVPDLDTEVARTEIKARMLREPADYIDSCRAALAQAGVPITVEACVTMGHRLSVYRELVARHGIDLLVLDTKDEDQLAMHGLAYPIAVELRSSPMLLL